MNHVFHSYAVEPKRSTSHSDKQQRKPLTEEERKVIEQLRKLVRKANSKVKDSKSVNDYLNKMIIGEKTVLDWIKKAGYYNFYIVKRDFHLDGTDYYKGSEIREPKTMKRVFSTLEKIGQTTNDYIRVISAPNTSNRLAQTYVLELLQNLIDVGFLEIDQSAHGFVKSRNIKTNVLEHFFYLYENMSYEVSEEEMDCIKAINPNSEITINYINFKKNAKGQLKAKLVKDNNIYAFNVDLENFFCSYNTGYIMAYFTKIANRNVARKIVKMVTKQGKMVQGSILSPMLTNLFMYRFDKETRVFASRNGLKYTRYADDIMFSSRERIGKKLSFKLLKQMKRFNLKPNPKKIGFQTNILDCNGLILNAHNIREGKEPIRTSKKFIKKTQRLIKTYNEGVREAFGQLKQKGVEVKTKQEYRKLIQSELKSLTHNEIDEHLFHVSLGNAAHVSLAKKFTRPVKLRYGDLVFLTAKTGLKVVDKNNFKLLNKNC